MMQVGQEVKATVKPRQFREIPLDNLISCKRVSDSSSRRLLDRRTKLGIDRNVPPPSMCRSTSSLLCKQQFPSRTANMKPNPKKSPLPCCFFLFFTEMAWQSMGLFLLFFLPFSVRRHCIHLYINVSVKTN